MSLEDELKLQEANQKISDLMSELNEAKEKVSDLITELNDSKNKEIMLSGEVRSLQSEIKFMESNKKNIDILNDRIEFLEKERTNTLQQVEDLENKLEKGNKRIEELLNEKTTVLESKNEILQKVTDKELELQQKDQAIGELREKFKKSNSELLSKTMHIDKIEKKLKILEESEDEIKNLQEKILELEKKLKEKEELSADVGEKNTKIEELQGEVDEKGDEIAKLNQKVEELSSELELHKGMGETGAIGTEILRDLNQTMEIIKRSILEGRNSIRLVLTEIHDLEKYNLIDTIKSIPNNVVLNIAAKIENPYNDMFVVETKKAYQLTNYSEKQFIALNVDGVKCLIGNINENSNEITGIYTEDPQFVELFKLTIMEPFTRGKRIF